MSNEDISLKISAAVEGNQEITDLQKQLKAFGDNNTAISNSVDQLVNEINKISDATDLIKALAEANSKVSESANTLDEAKSKYDDLVASIEEFKESNDTEGLRNAELALKAQEREVLRLTAANNRAIAAQETLNSRIDASNVANLVRDQEALSRTVDSVAQSQEMLNDRLRETIEHNSDRRLLNVDGASEQQEKIEELRAAYQRLAEGGELTAQELRDAHRNMQDGIDDINSGMDRTTNASGGVEASFGKLAVAALSFAGIAATIKGGVNAAIEFEAAMADVAKTFNDLSDVQIKGLSEGLMKLTREIPMTAVELAKIAEAGGQLGVAASDLEGFVSVVSKMSIAFNMTADEAGQSIGNLQAVFKTTIAETESLGDAINQLSNNANAKAPEIIEVMTKIGASAKSFGLANEQVAALSSTFLSLGMSPEIAATSIKNFLNTMSTGEKQGVAFQTALQELGLTSVGLAQAIRENPVKAIQSMSGALENLSDSKKARVFTELFGKENQANMKTFAAGSKEFNRQLQLIGDNSKYAGSMQAEFDAKSKTAENQLKLLGNAAKEAAINLGNAFLPAINDIAKALTGVAQVAADVAKEYPNVVKYGVLLAGLIATVKLLIAAVALFGRTATAAFASATAGAASFSAAMNSSLAGFPRLLGAFSALGGVVAKISAAVISLPGAMIAGSLAVGGAIGTLLNKFEAVQYVVSTAFISVKQGFSILKNVATLNFSNIAKDIREIGGEATELGDNILHASSGLIEQERELARMKKERLDKEKQAADAKKVADDAERDRAALHAEQLKGIEKTYGDIIAKRVVNEDGIFSQEAANSIERVDSELKKINLSFNMIERGISDAGHGIITVFDNITSESQATSKMIKEVFVEALNTIETPADLELLIEKFDQARRMGLLAAEDLALLSPVLTDIDAKIAEGLQPGAAFDEALNKWASSASNAAKGIKELTVEQEALNTQLAKEIDLINLTISSEIKKLKAKQDLARALGDVNGEAALSNEIAKLEVKLGSDVAAITAKKLALDKQVLASLQAKVASGQKLTASELAQKEALEKAIIENETAIAVYKISIETKQAEALASGQVIAGNDGIATSATGAASATAGLSNEMSGLADTASSAKTEVDEAVQSFSSGNIAGSAKNWSLINEQTRKELQETAKYWNHLTSYQRTLKKKEIQEQVDEYDRLMQKMSDVKEMSAEEAEKMLASFKRLNLLDQQQMASMKSQLYDIVQRSKEAKEAVSNEVQARIKAIADEATGAVDGALKKLDELNNRSKDQNESKASEMEAKAAQAAAEGNQEAAAKFLEAAQLFDEIARKEKANERMKQQQVAHDAYMSKKEPEVLGYYEIKVEAGNKVMTLPAPTKEFVKQIFDVIEQVKRTSM